MISGLRRQRPRSHAVLEYQHTIAIESANNRARSAGPEAPFRNTWLMLEYFAQRWRGAWDQLRRIEGCHGGDRVQRRLLATRCRYRDVLVDDSQFEWQEAKYKEAQHLFTPADPVLVGQGALQDSLWNRLRSLAITEG